MWHPASRPLSRSPSRQQAVVAPTSQNTTATVGQPWTPPIIASGSGGTTYVFAVVWNGTDGTNWAPFSTPWTPLAADVGDSFTYYGRTRSRRQSHRDHYGSPLARGHLQHEWPLHGHGSKRDSSGRFSECHHPFLLKPSRRQSGTLVPAPASSNGVLAAIPISTVEVRPIPAPNLGTSPGNSAGATLVLKLDASRCRHIYLLYRGRRQWQLQFDEPGSFDSPTRSPSRPRRRRNQLQSRRRVQRSTVGKLGAVPGEQRIERLRMGSQPNRANRDSLAAVQPRRSHSPRLEATPFRSSRRLAATTRSQIPPPQ